MVSRKLPERSLQREKNPREWECILNEHVHTLITPQGRTEPSYAGLNWATLVISYSAGKNNVKENI